MMARRRTVVQLFSVFALVAASQTIFVSRSSAANHTSIDVKSIIAKDYSVNNADNATLNYALQASHEQGTALVMDDAAFRAAKASGNKTLDGPRYYPFFGTVEESSVPSQSSYPKQFIAVVKQSSPAGTPSAFRSCPNSGSILVEQRDSPTSAWRLNLEPTSERLSSVPQLSPSGSFAEGGSYALNVSTLPNTFVKDLGKRAGTGNGGTLLPASVFAHGHCGDLGLVDPHSLVGTVHGLVQSFSASTISPTDESAYKTKDGGALALFTVREKVSVKSPSAQGYVVWAHGATWWWSLLPVGHYATVSWTIDQQVAVYVPSATSSASARVVGAYSEVIAVAGTPLR